MKHIFAICAYGDSPYLESCIRSLMAQTIPVHVILCTSTPSTYIQKLAEQYGLSTYTRVGISHIQEDWNFALQSADAELVTIAHQDDMYHKEYAATVQACWKQYPDTSVMMTDAVIVRNNQLSHVEKVMMVKKMLRVPLRLKRYAHQRWLKKSVLMLGNPVICPSCTYYKAGLADPIFTSSYQFALDWDTMIKLADASGRFICIEKPLLYYRIHAQATTSQCIKDHRREREEQEIFGRLWPKAVAEWLLKRYRQAYQSYEKVEK